MSIAWKGEKLGVVETRRHYTNYFKGIRGIKPFRQQLVTTDPPEELYRILDTIANEFDGYEF